MSYYICGIGFVTPQIMGSARKFNKVDNNNDKLNPLLRKDVLDKPYKPFGRMDFFSKTGFAGIHFACKDAGLLYNNKPSDTSIIAASRFGCLNTDLNYFNTIKLDNGKNASPQLFAYTLPNTFLGEASIFHNFTGENFVIGDHTAYNLRGRSWSFDNTFPQQSMKVADKFLDFSIKKELLNMSFDILDSSVSDYVICGLCDTDTPEFVETDNNHFYGSLFFVISRKKQDFFYGIIKDNNLENLFQAKHKEK